MSKKFFKTILVISIAVIIVNQFIGFAITPKPWYERLYLTLIGGGAGGVMGLLAGLAIGGAIGIAALGGGIGVPWVLAGAMLGFAGGSLTGSILAILQNPGDYDINGFKLAILIIMAVSAGFIVVTVFTGIFKRITSWLNAPSISAPDGEGKRSDE
ncbi:MAG: hypothetical protein LBM92_09535 [Opitutaceae bacterium]|jgi:hypothetical protein|nr:hypothetical protein [Opitutaceae bacterium]